MDKIGKSSSDIHVYMHAVSQFHYFLVHSFRDTVISGTVLGFSYQGKQNIAAWRLID